MYLTDTFYLRYFFLLHNELFTAAVPEMTSGEIDPAALYMAIPDLKQLLEVNLFRPLLRLARILWEGRAFKVLALFLLGIWAGRQILERNILSNTALLKKIVLWGLAISLP